jgi:hypothetical protein
MEISEIEKAILAIDVLSDKIKARGESLDDESLLAISSCLGLFLTSAACGDLKEFLIHINDFREKKVREIEEEVEDFLRERETGKKVTDSEKILRKIKLNGN